MKTGTSEDVPPLAKRLYHLSSTINFQKQDFSQKIIINFDDALVILRYLIGRPHTV